MNKIIFISIGVASLVAIFGSMFVMNISYDNQEIMKYEQIVASHENLKNHYDNTWKIIKQSANVTDNYKESFIEAYKAFVEGRYSAGQVQVVFESNPQFDSNLWQNLQNIIVAQRNKYTNEQERFLQMKNDYRTFVQVFPNSFFVTKRDIEQFKIITSTKTEKVFEDAKDDDVELF